MANKRIDELTLLDKASVTPASDVIPMVDVSDSNATKKVTIESAVQSTLRDAGSANGVLYLNASKVAVSSSALTFDGSVFAVAGEVRANATFRASDGTNIGIFGSNVLASGVVGITSSNSIPLAFGVAATEQMRLTSTGLGIGTSSPGEKLHVAAAGETVIKVAPTSAGSARLRLEGTGGGAGAIASRENGLFISTEDSGPIVLSTNSAEKMRLDSSGNLGLGVTPSAWDAGTNALQFNGAAVYGFTGGANLTQNAYYGGGWKYVANGAASYYSQLSGGHFWYTAPSGTAGNAISFTQAMDLANSSGASTLTINSALNTASTVRLTTNGGLTAGMFLANPSIDHSLGFQTAGTERARIDSSGNLLVGTTSNTINANGFVVQSDGVTKVTSTSDPIWVNRRSSTGSLVLFYNDSLFKGSISTDGTSVAYNTSSDYRLKNITGPVQNSGEYIDSLKPVEGTWKADGSTFVGLIAHEVQEVSRTQVATGEKDGAEMQAMDYSNSELIANLIAEVQSLRKRLAVLEAK